MPNSLAKHLGQLLDRSQQEKFANVLYELTRRAGTSLLFCRELLDLEFARKVGEEATILRENSLCTRYITMYTLGTAKSYLKRLLTAFILESAQENPTEQWYKDRVASLFNALCEDNMRSGMPRPVRAVVAIICEMAERYCPDRKYPLMAGYLFLRLVNPCLAAPQSYGLLPTEYTVPRAGLQNLLVFTKVLQHLSNNSRYAQYPLLERWISDMQPRMEAFLDQVVFDESGADPPFSDQIPAAPEKVNPLSVDPVMLYDLHGLLLYHRSALLEVKSRLEQGSSSSLVELYDELMAAMQEAVPQTDESNSYTSGSNTSTTAEHMFDMEEQLSGSMSPRGAATTLREADGTKESRQSGLRKTSDLSNSRKGNIVGNMKDKAMKLMNFSSSKNSSASSVVAPNSPPPPSPTPSSKSAVKDFVLNRLDVEDLSLTSNVALFVLLRVMMGKKDGVARTPDRHAFTGSDAVTWLQENLNLSHRGNALVFLRMAQAAQLILPADARDAQRDHRDVRIQDDPTLFVVESTRFRLWDSFVGKGDSPELDAISANVSATCGRVLSQTPRKAVDDVLHHNLEGLTSMAGFMYSSCGSGNRCEVQTAQEWLVLFGKVTHEQSLDVVRVLLKAKLIVSGSFATELRELAVDDVVVLLDCVGAAFCNQRGKHMKLWNRTVLVHALAGLKLDESAPPHETLRSEFSCPELVCDEGCRLTDLHATVQAQIARVSGKGKPVDYWMGLWHRLEELELLRSRRVLRMDAATQRMSEVCFWYVTSLGTEFVLEQQSWVPMLISFADAVLESVESQQPRSLMSSSQGRFFKRTQSGKQSSLRRSGTYEDDWQTGSDSSGDIEPAAAGKRSPRAKLMLRHTAAQRKPPPLPPPLAQAPLPPLARSSSNSDMDLSPPSPSSADMSRSDGMGVLARPPREKSPRNTAAAFLKTTSRSSGTTTQPPVRTARTNSANLPETPSVRPQRTNSNTNP